jgi:2'-5' RNA ligase
LASERIRSFVAIELPEELKALLCRLQERFRSSGTTCATWVRPEGIHLTLKFLGSIPLKDTQGITDAIEEAVQGITPIRLKVEGLGVFPNPRTVQVAWVGMGGEVDKLKRLRSNIDRNMSRIGFASETRPFTPHLTLARVNKHVSAEERCRFGRIITSTEFAAQPIEVTSISLMKSQLHRTGAVYSRISQIRLS